MYLGQITSTLQINAVFMSTVVLAGNYYLKQEVVVLWSPKLISLHTNVVGCPPCAFLNVRTHACWPGYDFRYILSFKLQMIPGDLVMINYKPHPRSRDVEERNKTPFRVPPNHKWKMEPSLGILG